MQRTRIQQSISQPRQGAAAVEFAFIFPLFMTLLLGTVELGRALDVSDTLTSAVREGGRLASMDIGSYVPSGSDANTKVINDITNFLSAAGVRGSSVTVTITEVDSATTFDLDDPANALRLFRITATVSYTDVSAFPLRFMGGTTLRSTIVFRLAQSTLS